MGQYGNQPDYAVKAVSVNVAAGVSGLNSAALYIGTSGDLEVQPVGNDAGDTVVFRNIPSGSFLPVIVSAIISGGNSTAQDVLAYY
ncbi:hypothetical protein DRO61_12040 [Candidatus Bathyarchaeota archaeon]|jgi:hypothetical protein|nr:MAG: hypothetical protein DRO61_12040 [Candidatus Bathyarchaeota archaeon]